MYACVCVSYVYRCPLPNKGRILNPTKHKRRFFFIISGPARAFILLLRNYSKNIVLDYSVAQMKIILNILENQLMLNLCPKTWNTNWNLFIRMIIFCWSKLLNYMYLCLFFIFWAALYFCTHIIHMWSVYFKLCLRFIYAENIRVQTVRRLRAYCSRYVSLHWNQ